MRPGPPVMTVVARWRSVVTEVRCFSGFLMMVGDATTRGPVDAAEEAAGPSEPLRKPPNDQGPHDANFRLAVGDWIVKPSTGRITRADETVKLEPKVMALLVYLARRPDELVTREEIEEDVWAGVIVGYDTVTGAVQKLRRAFRDDARDPRVIETISKKGYRLIAEVRYLSEHDQPMAPEGAKFRFPRSPRHWAAVTLIVLLVGTAVGVALNHERFHGLSPAKSSGFPSETRSIAVLPFRGLGNGLDQDYFVDGVTDDLITSLAKNHRLVVIARDSTFFYRESQLDIEQIAEKLKVRFVLRGTVRRLGERIRVNAQLVDVLRGIHVWAEQYDVSLAEIYQAQESIARKIEAALSVRASTGAQQDLGSPDTPSPQAYDVFLRGRHVFYRFANKAENGRARALFRKAVSHDVKFSLAYAMLAWTHAFDAMNGWSDNRGVSLRNAYRLATRAIDLKLDSPIAYFIRGLVHRERGDYVKALVEAEKAIVLDPSYANAHVLLATLLYYAGRPEEGLKRIQKAIKLNPHHPYNYTFHLGQAYYILGRYNEAIRAFKSGIATNPASERLHVWLAATYGQAGRRDQGEWEVEEVYALNPTFSLANLEKAFPFKDRADHQKFIEGLRKAGFSR